MAAGSHDLASSPYIFFFRYNPKAGLEVLKAADTVTLVGEELPTTAKGGRQRSSSLNSDLFLAEQADVWQRLSMGARVMGVMLHSVEAVVSWNGSQPMYAVRESFLNAQDREQWVNVGYIPHIPKVVGNGRNGHSREVVRDSRKDLVQRCYAVMMRQLMEAREKGIVVNLPQAGRVLLVPRILGLVVDQVEERCLMALMGNGCHFCCTHCVAHS